MDEPHASANDSTRLPGYAILTRVLNAPETVGGGLLEGRRRVRQVRDSGYGFTPSIAP